MNAVDEAGATVVEAVARAATTILTSCVAVETVYVPAVPGERL